MSQWCVMDKTLYNYRQDAANSSRYIHINSVRKFSALFNNNVGKCCLHSFYYIHFTTVSIYFHCSASIPYRGQKANWLYQEWKFQGTFAPGNFRGAKIPGIEKSWYRFGVCVRLKEHFLAFKFICQLWLQRSRVSMSCCRICWSEGSWMGWDR